MNKAGNSKGSESSDDFGMLQYLKPGSEQVVALNPPF